MYSYIAAQGKRTCAGGWYSVLVWSGEHVKQDSTPIKILRVRPGERYAKVFAEITRDGVRMIADGRLVAAKSLNG